MDVEKELLIGVTFEVCASARRSEHVLHCMVRLFIQAVHLGAIQMALERLRIATKETVS